MQMLDSTPEPALSLSGFLSFLYGGFEDGYIYAPTLNRDTGAFSQTFVRVKSLGTLEKHIRESAAHTDVYLSPAIYASAKATKENFLASNVVWAEFDGKTAEYNGSNPSVSIRSSLEGHTHCYWRLDEPLDNAVDLENINRALAYSLGADKTGWDANQILRPPETHNYKRDLPVEVQEVTGLIYNIGAFSGFKAPDRLEDSSIHLNSIPDVMDVIYEYALGTKFKDVFTSSPSEGDRSTYYMRVGYLAAEAGCTNEEIFALISNFDARVGKYSKREDRVRRLIDIIERVRLKYPQPSDEDGVEADEVEIYDIISFGNQTLEVDWLLPSLLQSGGNMLLVGPPGVGKTQVALNFAYGLATGQDVLTYQPDRPRKILFVSCEMGPVDLKSFTDQMTARYEKHSQLLSENFFVLPLGEPMYLNTKEQQDKMRRIVDVLKVDGIIFDSLGSATNKALTDEESVKMLLDWNDRFRKDMGVFSWFIHHNRKATENNKEPSGLADVYGSQYITARATTVLSLWPVKQNVLKVRELKKRLAPQEDDWFIKRTKHLNFERTSKDEAIPTVISSKIGKAVGNDGNGHATSSNPYGI